MTSNNELYQTGTSYVQDSRTNTAFKGNAALVLGHRYEDFGITTHSLFHGRFCDQHQISP